MQETQTSADDTNNCVLMIDITDGDPRIAAREGFDPLFYRQDELTVSHKSSNESYK